MTNEEAIDYLKNHYMAYVEHLQTDKELIAKHNQVMDLAIEALEKQMPKKIIEADRPKVIYGGAEYDVKGLCQTCKTLVLGCVPKFCSCCGQALDWSEDDE